MKKHLFLAIMLLAAPFALVSCSDNDELEAGSSSEISQSEAALRTITCQAGGEGDAKSGQNQVKHRTTLSGNAVVWDQGDQFQIKKMGSASVIEATVSSTSCGLGISVDKPQGTTAYVRYSNIKVTVGGEDVTSTITSASASSGNTYKLGIYTPAGKYHYAAAGTIVEAQVNADKAGAIPLVQSSSSSPISASKKAVITLTDVEYSFDKTTWTKVSAENELLNPFGNKNGVSLKFTSDGLNATMTLASEQGLTTGTFTGTTSSSAALDGAMAVFPASAFSGFSAGQLSISMPATQSYVAESFDHKANVMVADVVATGTDDCHTAFRNMCGLLRIPLTGNGVSLSSITITDKSGKMLNGTATLPATDYATTGINCSMLAGGTSTLTLNCQGTTLTAEPTNFYFVVPVGALEDGVEATVYTDDNRRQSISITKPCTISRSNIKALPKTAIDKLSSAPFNVENAAVQKFMSYGKYASFGATSYFTSHSSELTKALCMDQDRPAEFTVTLTTSGSYTATLTDNTKQADVYTNRAFTGKEYAFYNMVPGHTYTYTIKSGNNTVKTGTFEAGGLVRMVRIDDSFNCRDLGGWTGLSGHKVAYEWLYRTGSLNGQWKGTSATSTTIPVATNYVFTEAGKQQVRDLGILAELDLRGRTGDGGPWSSESGIHSRSILEPHIPIAAADFKQIMTDLGLQQPLNNYAVVKDVAFIIDQVVNKNHPVAFHCKSGADRTGAVGMLILSLLGVDQGDVARDYELTTMSREKLIFNGTSGYQERLASSTSYGFFKQGFTTSSCQGSNAQEKAYYYLNQYFKSSGVAINASDLDAFIKKMLGLTSYTHPTWAADHGYSLESIYNK